MTKDELLAEVNVIILRQSGADRRVLKDLGVARRHCCDQHLARLPDRENCEPVAFLRRNGLTQFDIAIDNSGERFPDRRGVFAKLCNAVERKKTEFCEEQAQLCWSTLAAEDIPYGLLRRVVFVGLDCAINHT